MGCQGQMMFGSALMIYEFADFVIGFIRGFSSGGLIELNALHVETLDRIRRAKAEQSRDFPTGVAILRYGD